MKYSMKPLNLSDFFRLCPPVLLVHTICTPDARAIFLHNDLLCNGSCSVSGGGCTTYGGGGGHKRKRSDKCNDFIENFVSDRFSKT